MRTSFTSLSEVADSSEGVSREMGDPWEVPKGPFWTPSRYWSLAILILETLVGSLLVGPERFEQRALSYVAGPSILGLICIWFPEELSQFRGYVGLGRYVDRGTPEQVLFVAGWVALLLPFVFWLLLKLSVG
jgi:hypothetical protein